MKLIKRLSVCLALGLVALSPLSSAQAQTETQVIRFSDWLPPAHYIVKEMLEPWAEEVNTVTEGRVQIESINPLGKPQAHLDLVRNGVADMGMGIHSYTANRFPLIEFSELPFTTNSSEINSIAYWDTYQKFMLDANEHRGVKLLGAWTSPGIIILTNKDNISSLEDIKGMKLRSPSPLFDNITKELGATPINATAPEAYEMLSRGVIDGMYFQHDQIKNFKLERLVKSVVVVPGGFGKTSQYLFMNEKKWNALSAEDQAAILNISEKQMAKNFGEKWDISEQNAIKDLAANGLKTYYVEGEELKELKDRLAFIETDWIKAAEKKNADGKAALEYYKAQIVELSN